MDLETYRRENALTTTELATKLGKPQGTVWLWCKRKVTPSHENMELIREKISKKIAYKDMLADTALY